MTNSNVLSAGSLDAILEQKNENLAPLVQILGTKQMNNNRIRAVISDGETICQHCIFISDDIEQRYNDGELTKFAVVRIDQYTISSLPKKENMPVILVSEVTLIKPGEELNRKLESNEPVDEATPARVAATPAPAAAPLATSSMNRPAPAARPSPAPSVSAATSGTLKSENVCPINCLTPFFNAWVIRARVTNKPPVKTYKNAKGEGKLFTFDCMDESGEIRITAFNAECDKFYDLIEPNKTYLISKGSVKPANKRFSSLNNDYEVTLSQHTVIEPCLDCEGSIPKMRFKFIKLTDLNNTAVNTLVDIIGVIRHVGETESLIGKKTNKEMIKREIGIVDMSLAEVRLTLWNEVANGFAGEVGQIIALKGALVGEYRGKTLSTSQSTYIQTDPDVPEADLLRNWYTGQGSKANFTSLNQQGTTGISESQRFLSQVNINLVTGSANQIYSSVNGLIETTTKPMNHFYKSCGYNGCMKKVTENDGLYHCSKCDRTDPTFTWRLMLSVKLVDATGSLWVTMFHEQAEKLLGSTVEELVQIYEMDQEEYSNVVSAIRFKSYFFRIGSRLDNYNDEQRVRSSGFSAVQHTPVDRSKRLLASIPILARQLNA